jgi:hypothetical protein
MQNTTLKPFIMTLGLIALFLNNAHAQIGIGTNTPDASAALDITASGSAVGLLLPRLTAAERDASIKTPAVGIVIYNTTTKVVEVSISGSLWADVVNGTNASVTSGTTSSTGKIGIGTASPNANAVLDVTSTTKGVLLPRSTVDPTGVEGMIYYNTTSDIVKLYNGTSWITLTN